MGSHHDDLGVDRAGAEDFAAVQSSVVQDHGSATGGSGRAVDLRIGEQDAAVAATAAATVVLDAEQTIGPKLLRLRGIRRIRLAEQSPAETEVALGNLAEGAVLFGERADP